MSSPDVHVVTRSVTPGDTTDSSLDGTRWVGRDGRFSTTSHIVLTVPSGTLSDGTSDRTEVLPGNRVETRRGRTVSGGNPEPTDLPKQFPDPLYPHRKGKGRERRVELESVSTEEGDWMSKNMFGKTHLININYNKGRNSPRP